MAKILKNKISQYNKIREKLKTGDVVAFQGSDAGALAIQKGTNSNYSHVGLVIRFSDIDRNFILESVVPKGVMLMPLSRKLLYYKGGAWWVPLDDKRPNITDEVRKQIYYAAMQDLGREYDYNLIGGIISKITGLSSRIKDDDFGSFICSELVASTYKIAGIFPKAMVTSETWPVHIVNLPFMGMPIAMIELQK